MKTYFCRNGTVIFDLYGRAYLSRHSSDGVAGHVNDTLTLSLFGLTNMALFRSRVDKSLPKVQHVKLRIVGDLARHGADRVASHVDDALRDEGVGAIGAIL